MDKLKRGEKIFLDKEETEESAVNQYLDARDGIVEMYEYIDMSGYGSLTRLFLCEDCKHESLSLIRHVYISHGKQWIEEVLDFDSDSFKFLKALVDGKTDQSGGSYLEVRNFTKEL